MTVERRLRMEEEEAEEEEGEDVITSEVLDDDENDGGTSRTGLPDEAQNGTESLDTDEGLEAEMAEAGVPGDPGQATTPTLYSVKRIIRESSFLLVICIALEIMGGQMLNSREATLVALPFILMAIPVINGVGGNIGTVLGMRFTTALHLGEITPSLEGRTLRSNLVQGLALGVISFGILALVTAITPVIWGFDPGIDPLRYGLIMFGAGLLLTTLVVVVTITAAVYAFKFGYDPDNMVTPIVTTTCDLLGIVSLLTLLTLVGVG